MAFPVSSVLDAFTGTNGTDLPTYSGNWATPASANPMEIQANSATGTANLDVNFAIWTASNFGPGCESFVTVGTPQADDTGVAVGVRFQGEGDFFTLDGYQCYMYKQAGAGNDTFTMFRYDDGVATGIGAAFVQDCVAGDSFGVEAVGSTLTVYYRSGAGSWVSLGTRNDATYGAAGKIGMYSESTAVRFDDFGGGTLTAVASLIDPSMVFFG